MPAHQIVPAPILDSYWVVPDRPCASEYPGAAETAAARNKLRLLLDAGLTFFLFIHCYGGIGRTGTIVDCYLVRHVLTGSHRSGEKRRQVGLGKALAAGAAKVRNLAQIVQQGRLQRVHRRNFLVIGLTEILAAAFLFNRAHATITAGTRAKPHNDFALAQVCAIMTLPRPGRTIMPGP